MEAKELRISNWVNYLDLPIQVDGIDDVDVFNSQTGEIPLHCIFPIPLTEDWIVKFGLSKQNGYPYKFNNGYLKIRNGVFFFKYHNIEVDLPFVHQLQNLYFALTGEELKIEKSVCDCGSTDVKIEDYGFNKCNDCKNEWLILMPRQKHFKKMEAKELRIF